MIKISHPDKQLFKKDKLSKLDLAIYYNEIAPLMLKQIRNRPLSVIRCHVEANDSCFFKKHPSQEKEYVETFFDGEDEYFYVRTKSQLVYQVQLGTVEFHIWGSKYPRIDSPNLMVFDLDPDEALPIKKLREATLLVKQTLTKLNLNPQLKTSGGKGYHIYLNISKKMDWQAFSNLAKEIALLIESEHPKIFTTSIKKSSRKNKIFIDYLRNKKGSTCVAPFSVRARAGAPISFPIPWDKLFEITPNEITIKNYKNYLDKT